MLSFKPVIIQRLLVVWLLLVFPFCSSQAQAMDSGVVGGGQWLQQQEVQIAAAVLLVVLLVLWVWAINLHRKVNRQARKLQESESKYKSIIHAQPDLMFLFSREGEHLDYYAPARDQLFLNPDEFLGKRVDEVMPAPVGEEYSHAIQQVLETAHDSEFEYQLDFPDGRRFYDCRMVPVESDQALAIVRDVTREKLAESALRASEEQLRSVVQDSPALVCRNLTDGTIVFVNDAYCKYFNKTQDELIGNNFFSLIPNGERPNAQARLAGLNANNPVLVHEH